MAIGFPLHIDLEGNNCTVFGGSEAAARRAEVLLRFGAKVTELHRLSMGGFSLPEDILPGECRELSENELSLIESRVN